MKFLALFILITITVSAQTGSLKEIIASKDYQISQTVYNDISQNLTVPKSSKKSPGLAILYSLILPGMGELYAENFSSGKYFTIADVSLIGVYIGMNEYGYWKKDNYMSFAASVGSVNIDGKNEEFFSAIGEHKDIEQYNDLKSLSREFDKMYDAKTHYWKWQSDDDRESYRSMWLSSKHATNNLRFVVGAMLLNRLVSAINAVRSVSAYNKNLELDNSTTFYFETYPPANYNLREISFNITTSF